MAQTRRCATGNYAPAIITGWPKEALYVHLACGQDVVWAHSKRTGKPFLATVVRAEGTHARRYVPFRPHTCPEA